jgi:single-strand DNA-binding protein
MINKVILVGNLGKDPDIRTLENGTKVGTFSVATNESYKDKNDQWQTLTEWHNVVVWRSLAERAERELKKGGMVYIEGKLTHRRYQDKDGVERSITEIVANTCNSLERREKSSAGINTPFPSLADDPSSRVSVSNPNTGNMASEPTSDVDDLPF